MAVLGRALRNPLRQSARPAIARCPPTQLLELVEDNVEGTRRSISEFEHQESIPSAVDVIGGAIFAGGTLSHDMNEPLVKRTLLAWLALVAIGGAPLTMLACAWSCTTSHHAVETAHHHECEVPPTPGAARLASDTHCDDHSAEAAVLAIASPVPYSAPAFDGVIVFLQPVPVGPLAPVAVVPQGPGPPLPQRSSILRV